MSTSWSIPPARPAGARTVQFSAENPDGSRNRGARAVPDPAAAGLRHSAFASDLGRGYKVRPYVDLPAGETLVLADARGPGCVTHIWMTTNYPAMSVLRLRCYWDGAVHPAVDVPAGLFFAMGHDERPHTVLSQPVVVAPSRGCACYWPMPFATRALITLTNTGEQDIDVVAYRVTCVQTDEASGEDRFHTAAATSHTGPEAPDHAIAAITGRGSYLGTALAWTALEPGWWGEGELKYYLGNDEFPTLVDSGTEDHFGGAWGFGRDAVHENGRADLVEEAFSAPFAGAPLIERDESGSRRISLYRWHIPDPVFFDDGLRVAVPALGWGPNQKYRIRSDIISSAAYWYATP